MNGFEEIHIEYQIKNRRVDVVGFEERGEKGLSVAIECGDCTLEKLENLSPDFTWMYHLTWQGELKMYPNGFNKEEPKKDPLYEQVKKASGPLVIR